jgi:lauroyl/myristoyl acyltransferase
VVAPERDEAVGIAPTPDSICTPQPVPWGGLVARLRASVRLRRFVPTGPALAATDLLHGALLRAKPARLAEACAVMEAIVGGTPLEHDIPRLARAHVASAARQWELTWRPWELERLPVEGIEHLHATRAAGRGTLFSFMHYGPFVGFTPLARLVDLYTPVGDWLAEKPRAGYNGYQLEQRRFVLCSNFRMVEAGGSARTLMRVLRDGGHVLLAMDLPGKTPTRFLGKTAELTNGTARLATATGCLVVPVALVPRGRSFTLRLHEPVDPREHASSDALHQALATTHEKIIMQAPEHLESPLRAGGWKVANREGWHVR